MHFPRLSLLLAFLLSALPGLAATYAWVEGESPARASIPVQPQAWGQARILSGGQWLAVSISEKELPAKAPDGVTLGYDTPLDSAGQTQIWARVGYEFVRSDFEWRIDGGDWTRIGARDRYTTDLMELQRWNEVGWMHLATRDLAAGKHTLEFRLPITKDAKGKATRLLFALDAVCLYQGDWLPNGKHKPDADWRSDRDRAAEKQVYALPAATPGGRSAVQLTGLWQAARFDEETVTDRTGPLAELPDLDRLHWTAMPVPSNKDSGIPDWVFCHRYLLRTRVDVPATLAGRSFVLDVAEAGLMATVFVNGRQVAFSDAHLSPFTTDVTAAITPGQVNEIVVCLKDRYYSVDPEGDKPLREYFNTPSDMMDRNQGVTRRYQYPTSAVGSDSGLTDHVTLVATGGVYTHLVTVGPSVQDNRLTVTSQVRNNGDAERRLTVRRYVQPRGEDTVALAMPDGTVTVPAGESVSTDITADWADPVLWWPDAPQMYDLVTELRDGETLIDTQREAFGFAQWQIVGTRWHLNGVPWQLRANLDYYGCRSPEDRQKALDTWAETGQNMFRFRFQRRWGQMTSSETMAWLAENGVPMRYNIGTLDGQHAAFAPAIKVGQETVPNEPLYRNWQKQARARVMRYRNNPAIFAWELDNEFIYINCRNFGLLSYAEPFFTETARMCQALDPQGRGQLPGGGRALMDQSLPVNGGHYEESPDRDYPDMAYGLGAWTDQSRSQPWPMALEKPIFLSEVAFVPGRNPSDMAGIGGEICFGGKGASYDAYGLLLRIYSEGYRWQALGGYHFWAGSAGYGGEGYHLSWQPEVALIREWDSALAAGATVTRTVMVRNDTRFTDPITMAWRLEVAGQAVADGQQVMQVPAGEGEIATIAFAVPAATTRQAANLVLTLSRRGEPVWERVTPMSVLPPATPVTAAGLGVWDPRGQVTAYLREAGIAFQELADTDEIPDSVRTLIVGSDAIDASIAADPRFCAAALAGRRVIVLDQAEPLRYVGTPTDADVTDFSGRVAFSQDLSHPIFAGLTQADFFCWTGDHIVYRHAYRKPTQGARSLLQCDRELAYTALMECQLEDGLLLISQAAIGAKLTDSPAARQLLHNMINYADSYERRRSETAVLLPQNDPRRAILEESGLVFSDAGAFDPASSADVWIVDGTKPMVESLAAADLSAFYDRGGAIMIWGLTPAALPAFRRLSGVNHQMRPFRREKVALSPGRPAIAANLSQSDVSMYSGERIAHWMQLRWMSDDVFSHVVDLRDVAPFLQGPGIEPDNNGGSIVNGFTDAEFWRYVCYFGWEAPATAPKSMRYTLPQPQDLRRLVVRPNGHYAHIEQLTVSFNDDPSTAVTLDFEPYTKEENPKQEFAIQADDVSSLTIAFSKLSESDKTVTGIDNIWLYAERPADFDERVQPLVDDGGLVWYPRGQGGILLNQLHVPATEAVPENGDKRRAITNVLLRNMDAVFSGRRSVMPGENLAYEPVSFESLCNLYLTSAQGFPDKAYDLKTLPLGDQRFGGVHFHIRDFKTSPLESAITLSNRSGVKAPASVDVPVGRAADAVFFLHGMLPNREWKPRRDTDQPPILWSYVVHYADGKTAPIEVRYNEAVAAWRSSEPMGLEKAAIAWTAPITADGSVVATIYQTQWVNPRPDVAIDHITIETDAKMRGSYGAPIVLGITTATRPE